jgi:magnesium transporter
MLENFKEIVEALESTNEQLISHKVNDVLRVLTAFSVAILPLTLIASIWGMNVHVPGQGDLTAFYAVIAFMAIVLAAMVAYFRKRGFL